MIKKLFQKSLITFYIYYFDYCKYIQELIVGRCQKCTCVTFAKTETFKF